MGGIGDIYQSASMNNNERVGNSITAWAELSISTNQRVGKIMKKQEIELGRGRNW